MDIEKLRAILAEFDAEVADVMASDSGERADLWTDIDVPVASLRALIEENDRLRSAVTASKPIIVNLIEIEFNVETWGLKQRLAAIDAALARRLDGDVR